MPGGGLIVLVSYGAQNTILSGNPQFTYFYKNFRRYSHFSQESVTIALEGQNELFYDRPIQLRVKIQRVADLLSDLYFTFRVPDIYCKDVSVAVPPYNQRQARYTDSPNPNTAKQFNFQWVRYLGAHIIQHASFHVGGQKIQEFDSDYIIAKAHADLDQDEFAKWQRLIGDIRELNDPANGIYAGIDGNNPPNRGYPIVVSDGTNSQQANNPSIPGQDIHVPLPFWFTQSFTNALPLVALQSHECEIQLTLRPIQELYTILDVNGYRVAPGYKVNTTASDLSGNKPAYMDVSGPSGQADGIFNLFTVDFGYTPPVLPTWFLNPRIQCTFTYLTDDERNTFASQPLSYLMYQTTRYSFPGMYNRQILDLETHNPVNRILFVPRRSDSLQYKNDVLNWTNWWNYPAQPFKKASAIATNKISSGLIQPATQIQIIRNLRILLDGNEAQEEKPTDYFTKITPWRYENGGAAKEAAYLPVYSFSLESPSTQPTGSLNTSRVRVFQVEVDPWPLSQNTNYVYDLAVYVENINWFEVASGMGGLKWAL
jgi:hypothetical protein